VLPVLFRVLRPFHQAALLLFGRYVQVAFYQRGLAVGQQLLEVVDVP
jgi:hypothetical protein